MSKRPFRKVKGTCKDTDRYAVTHNRRPFVFNFASEDGGTAEVQGSIRPQDCHRFFEILDELMELHKSDNKGDA